jgi:molybdopterin-guanine dinucleotide biosynthesis protein A
VRGWKHIQKHEITTIVLAGGKSSRLGRDKALINVNDIPLLRKICLLASECTSEVHVITSWPERYLSIIPSHCQLIQEVLLAGEIHPHGPLVGFAQGLSKVKTEWVLLLACDLPCLTASVIRRWINSLDGVGEGIKAVLPRQNQRWEPVCGFYRRSCLPSLDQFVQQGGRAFQPWLQTLPVQELIVEDSRVLFNCNTPADWQQVNRFLAGNPRT